MVVQRRTKEAADFVTIGQTEAQEGPHPSFRTQVAFKPATEAIVDSSAAATAGSALAAYLGATSSSRSGGDGSAGAGGGGAAAASGRLKLTVYQLGTSAGSGAGISLSDDNLVGSVVVDERAIVAQLLTKGQVVAGCKAATMTLPLTNFRNLARSKMVKIDCDGIPPSEED